MIFFRQPKGVFQLWQWGEKMNKLSRDGQQLELSFDVNCPIDECQSPALNVIQIENFITNKSNDEVLSVYEAVVEYASRLDW